MKKIYLLALFALLSAVNMTAKTVVYLGDLNGDGSVDGGDVSIILEQVLGGSSDLVADLNDDGSVDGSDVSVLLEIVLGGDPKPLYSIETYNVNGIELNMICVPGGTFTMGGTEEQGSNVEVDERPVHEVTLSDYQIGQIEVTQELWNAVMRTNPSEFKGDNLPVANVSWNDCRRFIRNLNDLMGLEFRLPTEAEWEYAARGGRSGGTMYSGSNTIGDVAWYYFNTNLPQPVGTKQANRLGIYDMSGNVAEWCSDWYDYYTSEAQVNPQGPTTDSFRVSRGGGWDDFSGRCRVSRRDYYEPTFSANSLGLRLAMDNVVTYTVNGVSFKMVEVQGGTFTMGATAEQGSDAFSGETPTHSVTLSDYQIGQTEVTQELWEAVMGSNPSYFTGENLPVEQVNWEDCQTFIAKLNQLTGEKFRLPTEAEWEYAARGGQSGGTKYAGSDNIDDVAWYTDNTPDKTTHPVATKCANLLHIYDMSGNVWEWCQDWYGSYSSSAQTNPQGPSSGTDRVYRGGSWNYAARSCRVSNRYDEDPARRSYDVGLRLAR